MKLTISDFLTKDNDRLEQLIEANPVSIPVSSAAEFLGADVASVRAAVENDCFGLSWRKAGSARHAYLIPTGQFVRWYLSCKTAI